MLVSLACRKRVSEDRPCFALCQVMHLAEAGGKTVIHHSLGAGLKGGIKASIIIYEYLAEQSWRISSKRYTSAPFAGCPLKNSCVRKLIRPRRYVGGPSCPCLMTLSEVSIMHLTLRPFSSKACETRSSPPPLP